MIDSLLAHAMAYPQLWASFAIITVAIFLYALETFTMILTSLIVLIAFMLLFHFMPIESAKGVEKAAVNPDSLLMGFASPALVAVLALLILGQAVVRTGALTPISNALVKISNHFPFFAVILTLVFVALISAFMNNTPTVIIFIPILLAVAANLKQSASAVMIPLSYASILGGGLVLIGSSTNLLVSAAAEQSGLEPLGFFDFTIPGLVIAGVGMLYVAFILPRVLPERAPLSDDLTGAGRQFVAQLEVKPDSDIVNKVLKQAELFGDLDVTIKMLQRKDHAFLPPFDKEVTLQAGDVIVITATRADIKTLLTKRSELFQASATIAYADEEETQGEDALTEVLITPASKLIGQTIEQIGFRHHYRCLVLGMQRKSRAITSQMTKTRLQPGDVLLTMASREDILGLRNNKDMLVMEWSTEELPSKKLARRVVTIFVGAIALAVAGVMPIHMSAMLGAALVIVTGCMNVRQAMRALDGNIVFLVAAGLAMSVALQETGGAALLAEMIISLTEGVNPVFIMSALFLLMALLTNILSNNATALLFTPIAISTANQLNAPVEMFLFAVIFASNCCALASPIGYQTNLLVMGPGHYKFADYMKAGIPLIILIWLTYTAFSYFYY